MIASMCRMLGYVGEPVRLSELIDQGPHSLERQSYAARELRGSVVCADGWGAGFYVPDDAVPCLYHSTLPIWADSNRTHLGRAIRTSCAVACVRSATDPLSVAVANTPPFSMGSLLLVHNGYIRDFSSTLRRDLERILSDEHYQRIRGRTDSEYLLALIADEYAARSTQGGVSRLFDAVQSTIERVVDLCKDRGTAALLTFIVGDGESLVATRAAHGDVAPSLYLLPAPSHLGTGALVASEPIDPSAAWRAIEADEAWIVQRGGSAERVALKVP
jgi:glutamine amidotransferase